MGSVLVSTYGADRCRSTVITVAVAAHGVAALGVAAAPGLATALVAVLLLGVSYVAVLATANATIQVLAAEAYRGRAASQYWMAFAGPSAVARRPPARGRR